MLKKIKNLYHHKEFKKYSTNTIWMLLEKTIRIIFILLVNILIARYLGVERFGYLSYVLSLVMLFSVMAHLGLSGIVIKALVAFPKNTLNILATSFYLKFIGGTIAFIILLLINLSTELYLSTNFYVFFFVSLIVFSKAFEVVEFWFNANIKAKYIALSSIISVFIASIIKIVIVYFNLGIICLSLGYTIEYFLLAILYLYFFNKITRKDFFSIKFSCYKSSYFLKKSWMIMLGGFFSIIYLKIDQVMLKWLSGDSSVGIYSVAASLSEVWYFIPTIIVTSLFPKIIELRNHDEKKYKVRLQQIFNFLFLLAFIISICVNILAKDLIILLYGNSYALSSQILVIHIWASVFIFMRALFSKWIIIENELMFSLITQGFGALFNILLNSIFIPYYGAIGAAVATFISYAVASYFALLFFSNTREIFWMMSKSLLLPITLPYSLIKAKYVN